MPLQVIGALKTKFTAQKMQKTLEKAMVAGLRRSAGLNLLSYAAMSKIGRKLDVFMWFVSSLKSNDKVLSHYSDGLTGCGDSVLRAVRT